MELTQRRLKRRARVQSSLLWRAVMLTATYVRRLSLLRH
jgi:hypothetical protein